MHNSLLESLLNEDEGTSLDFKRHQYPFVETSDEIKGELLKDILAFANSFRRTTAYILIGIEEVQGGRSKVEGVTLHLPDAGLQEFVNKKLNRPLTFSYEAFPFEGKQVGIIEIPVQERPFYLKKNFGKLIANAVYFRRGSSTDIASPDEITKMGMVRGDDVNTHTELTILLEELQSIQQKLGSGFDLYAVRMKFGHDQYLRLFDKGIINRLSTELRVSLKVAYDEIRELDRLVNMAWDSGGRNNKWAENLNEAKGLLSNAERAVAAGRRALEKHLNLFAVV